MSGAVKLIVTFHSTVAAMQMEATCGRDLGRLIPLPQMFDAGCGLAWLAPRRHEQEILDILEKNCIAYSGIHEMPM